MEIDKTNIKRFEDLSKLKFDEEKENQISLDFLVCDEVKSKINENTKKEYTLPTYEVEVEDLREDIVEPSYDRSKVLENAPHKDSLSFIVPKVVE